MKIPNILITVLRVMHWWSMRHTKRPRQPWKGSTVRTWWASPSVLTGDLSEGPQRTRGGEGGSITVHEHFLTVLNFLKLVKVNYWIRIMHNIFYNCSNKYFRVCQWVAPLVHVFAGLEDEDAVGAQTGGDVEVGSSTDYSTFMLFTGFL